MSNDSVIRVAIIDDHTILVEGLVMLLKHEPDIEYCGSAKNLHDGLKLIETQQPHLAIVDLSLEHSHGMDLIKDCKIRFPQAAILVLSMHDESIYAERAIRAGAKGYIMKNESLDTVVLAVRAICNGELYMSDAVKKQMLQSSFNLGNPAMNPISCLADRELEVFTLIGNGLRPRHIADKLNMSTKTVDSHCRRIREKLNLDGMTELIQAASKWVQSSQQS